MRPCPRLSELPPPPSGKLGWPWTEESPPTAKCMSGGTDWPAVSIVMPSLNSAPFLEETIRSVLLQGYPAVELIIVDGGSTDGTVEIIKKYGPWLSHWVSEPDKGQSNAVNKGIRRATAEILLWLNADDLCLPGAFVAAATGFAQPAMPALVVGQAMVIDRSGNTIEKLHSTFTSWYDYACRRNTLRQVSTFFRRDVLFEVGLLDESLRYSMDRDLLLRLTKTHRPQIVADFLTAFRRREDSRFHGSLVDGYRESDQVTARHLTSPPWRSRYREWSALHWLFLAQNPSLPAWDRVKCVYFSLKQLPSIFFRRSFWIHMAERRDRLQASRADSKSTD